MHLKLSKLVFGTLMATSLGLFTVPAHASRASAFPAMVGGRTDRNNVIIAQEEHHELEDKAQGKVNEMHDAASGAANAVEQKHEEHEAAENGPHHHGLKHKAKSKMNEAEGEASGAAGAVENAHHEHEKAEHE
jgi:hypothetical protein